MSVSFTEMANTGIIGSLHFRGKIYNFWLGCFEEKVEVLLLSYPCRHRQRWRHRAKTSAFPNISVITEDIDLKLRLVV